MTTLMNLVSAHEGRLVAPLVGYPAARLTGSSVRENLLDGRLHARSIGQFVRRFSPDVAFLMMDLSVEAGAIGLPIRFAEDESPTVERPLVRSLSDLASFETHDPLSDSRLQGFLQAMRALGEAAPTIAGAYVIGPFTLAGLMMGATQLAVSTVKNPSLVLEATALAERVVTAYARELCRAGADLIAVLEPTAALLSPAAFDRFCVPAVSRLFKQLEAMTVLHICGNTAHLIAGMAGTGAQGLSLDAPVSLPAAARAVPPDTVLIGNVNPVAVMLNGTPATVRAAVSLLLRDMAPYPNFIPSTGCDCPFWTPMENLEAFMAAARS